MKTTRALLVLARLRRAMHAGDYGTFRTLLESLGPVAVKVGQYLSLRPDLIGQELADALLELTDSRKPIPEAVVHEIVRADLGGGCEALLTALNPVPIGVASLAQVHAGPVTADDVPLAVKVMRPDVAEEIHDVLGPLKRIAYVVDAVRAIAPLRAKEIVREISGWMEQELDFERERENLAHFHELLARVRTVRVPRPIDHLSGPHVLTQERLDGTPMSRILRWLDEGKENELEALELDRHRLSENLVRAVLDQVFRLRYFHADTHPGNLIALSGNVVGFVDFGLVERLDSRFASGLSGYLCAIYFNDLEAMLRGLNEILVIDEGSDVEGFRGDVIRANDDWSLRRNRPQDDGARSPTGHYIVKVVESARRRRLGVPAGILSMVRALLAAETIAYRLSPGGDHLRETGRQFFRELQIEGIVDSLKPSAQRRELLRLVEIAREGPGKVFRIVDDLAEDRFVLRVESQESAASRRQGHLRAKLLACALLAVGVALLLAVGADARLPFGLSGWHLLVPALLSLYVCIAVIWRWMR